MQRFIIVAIGCALAGCDSTTSAPGGCESNNDCQAGQVCNSGTCATLCSTDNDCGTANDCTTGKICSGSTCITGCRADVPLILSVDGDGDPDNGPPDMRGMVTDHMIQTGLTITGEHLDGATVSLADSNTSIDLPVTSSTDVLLVVDVPATVAEGEYILRVINAAGEDQVTAWVVRGQPGETGPTGPMGVMGAPGTVGPTGPVGPSWVMGGSAGAIISTVTITARSDCGSDAPVAHMGLFLNGALDAEWDVPNASYATFVRNLPVPTYADEIVVAYMNDNMGGGCDHNLYVQSVALDSGPTMVSTDTTRVIYDKGNFFDRMDVAPGAELLDVTGALRFFVAPKATRGNQRQTVFRVTSGGSTNPTTSFAAMPNANGTAIITGPFCYALQTDGIYTDMNGRSVYVRIRFTPAAGGSDVFLPDSTGHMNYYYVDNSRLDSWQNIHCSSALPSGEYSATLEWRSANTDPLTWNSIYGHLSLAIW